MQFFHAVTIVLDVLVTLVNECINTFLKELGVKLIVLHSIALGYKEIWLKLKKIDIILYEYKYIEEK